MRRTFPALLLLLFGSSFAARPASAEQAGVTYYFWRDSNSKCMAKCDTRPIWCCPCILEIPIFTPYGPV